MSGARADLYMALWDNYTPVEKNRLIAAAFAEHAHELAEKIRAWAAVEVGGEIEEIYGYAADLVDPEVSG